MFSLLTLMNLKLIKIIFYTLTIKNMNILIFKNRFSKNSDLYTLIYVIGSYIFRINIYIKII